MVSTKSVPLAQQAALAVLQRKVTFVDQTLTVSEWTAVALVAYVAYVVFKALVRLFVFVFEPQPPRVVVPLEKEETENVLVGYKKFDYAMVYSEQGKGPSDQQRVHMFDPSTLDYFGSIPATTPAQVKDIVASARAAQAEWGASSFAKRRLLMRTMQRYMAENADVCARVSARDSGASPHQNTVLRPPPSSPL